MSDVLEAVGTIDRANKDLVDDDALLIDTGDDELYVVRLKPNVDAAMDVEAEDGE